MTDDLDELAAEGEKTGTSLEEVTALAYKMLDLQATVAKREAALTEAKEALRKIEMGDLPAALKAARMKEFQLENGMTVSYKEDLTVSVPKARKGAVIDKMREWGYAASVSNVLTVDLGKSNDNNDNVVKSLMATAEEMGVKATVSEDIATGTVKSALKKRIENGLSDDLSFFGAFSLTKATVK
jgi:hypothetical protein